MCRGERKHGGSDTLGDQDTFILKRQMTRINWILHLAKIARPDEGVTIGTRSFLASEEDDLQESASIILSLLTPAATQGLWKASWRHGREEAHPEQPFDNFNQT